MKDIVVQEILREDVDEEEEKKDARYLPWAMDHEGERSGELGRDLLVTAPLSRAQAETPTGAGLK